MLGDGDRALLHRLEQRRLRLGRGAVDLVGEHDVGEDRARLELETPCAPRSSSAMIVRADDVGRHQVGRELDARKRQSIASASVRTSSVLPRPGTPSSSAWPPASSVITPSNQRRWPTMTLPTSFSIATEASRNCSGESSGDVRGAVDIQAPEIEPAARAAGDDSELVRRGAS